ncbi:MAG TPA: cation-translocating P-type ATPase [Nitrososphaeraceae archaeon]|nr:cation-translocating P-type ATPase [Nitrososphaeraceae archaeon]
MSSKTSWHSLNAQQVLDNLHSHLDGLTGSEAKEKLEKCGLNQIEKEKQRSSFFIFIRQLKDPMILILFVATFISFILGEIIDGIIIVAILIMTTIVGFIQEFRSEKAIDALMKMTATTCRVLRDNKEKIIETKYLVPGDIILLYPGDKIPADSYIIEAYNLETNEASLTGESLPIEKMQTVLPKETQIQDRKNILYAITTIVNGRGKAVIFETGRNTEIGKITTVVQGINTQKTPFELKIKHIVKLLSLSMLIIVGILSVISLIRGLPILEILIGSISLAVAAIPEALPAIITTSLTIGAYRMAKKNALIRRLPAVETLGSTTVICSDKTGTLTKGEMTVKQVYMYDNHFIEVTGVGYNTKGSLSSKSNINKNDLMLLVKCTVLCNDAKIELLQDDIIKMFGDPTEIALLIFAKKIGIAKDELSSLSPRLREIPFTAERKMMITFHRSDKTKDVEVFAKGAPEIILNHCNRVLKDGQFLPLTDKIKDHIISINYKMANDGLRVLALATTRNEVQTGKILVERNINNNNNNNYFLFLGLVGIIDPPRKEVKDAISQCNTSGINVIMITGDQKFTALAIAKEIGIVNKYETDIEKIIVSGQELEKIDFDSFNKENKKLNNIKIYSRVLPEQKLKIVQTLKNNGHIVAVTGDGVNDAPALKTAHIGVAMGITGTDVAKESSSMILADDNFATIVSAIHEGRRIFDNIKKYLVYLLSANISELLILTFAIVMGWPSPLLAKHILYINLATDGSPAIALSTEPSEPDIMRRKPKNPNETIFFGVKKWLIPIPIILATVALFLFWNTLNIHGWDSEYGIAKARTMAFALIVFFELFFAFSCRSFRHNINKLGFLSNKFLIYSLLGETFLIVFFMNYPPIQEIFELVPLAFSDWIIVLLLATTGLIYSETIKLFNKDKDRR